MQYYITLLVLSSHAYHYAEFFRSMRIGLTLTVTSPGVSLGFTKCSCSMAISCWPFWWWDFEAWGIDFDAIGQRRGRHSVISLESPTRIGMQLSWQLIITPRLNPKNPLHFNPLQNPVSNAVRHGKRLFVWENWIRQGMPCVSNLTPSSPVSS